MSLEDNPSGFAVLPMLPVLNIAPRVVLYPYGSQPPQVEDGWLALPQLQTRSEGAGLAPEFRCSTVQTRSAGPGLALDAGGSVATRQRHAVFGDGSHPTTRLCTGAVDLLCRQRPGLAVLDVGTGTGILARIAAARGASYVVGTDIDPAAVACARAHAELDSVTPLRSLVLKAAGAGGAIPADAPTAADIRTVGTPIYFGGEAPDHWGARFDLVVANILEAPLHFLAPALCRALLPGGVLLISGFTRPQAPALRLSYETAGLRSAGDFTLDDWVLLKFQRS